MEKPLDPSQKPAEPLPPVNPVTVLKRRALDEIEPEPGEQPEAIDNKQRAANEVAMIFELKDSRAFQWFEKEFIDKPYKEAFDLLRNPKLRQEGVTLLDVQAAYVVLRAVKTGVIEREIVHRETIDPGDEMIPVLRQKLDTL